LPSLLQDTLNETLAIMRAGKLPELEALLDPAWIEQALAATGKRPPSGGANCPRSKRCG